MTRREILNKLPEVFEGRLCRELVINNSSETLLNGNLSLMNTAKNIVAQALVESLFFPCNEIDYIGRLYEFINVENYNV